MAPEGFKRKLAAILSADVEGYSRLMDDDEEATVRTAFRNAPFDSHWPGVLAGRLWCWYACFLAPG